MRAFAHALYRLCGHLDGTFRVRAAAGDIAIDRRRRLPILELDRAAQGDGPFDLDPRIDSGGAPAYIALWVHAPSYDGALARLPEGLRPQLAVATPAGVAMIWVPPSPCPERPGPGWPGVAALLAALADALQAIPPGPEDGIPLPRSEADLVAFETGASADPAALWVWAQAAIEERARELRRALEAAAEAAAQPAAAPPPPGEGAIPQEEVGGLPEDVQEAAIDEAQPSPDVALPQPGDGVQPEVPALRAELPQPAAAAPQPAPAAPLDAAPALGPAMLRLLAALAHRAGVSPRDALSRALLAHAMAVLGTAEAYRALGVSLTWDRPDGLYGFSNGAWERLD